MVERRQAAVLRPRMHEIRRAILSGRYDSAAVLDATAAALCREVLIEAARRVALRLVRQPEESARVRD